MKRSRRRPWQPLLWGGLCFVAVQLGLGVALEARLEGVRDAEYAEKESALRARLAEAPARPLVLVLGSSRTMLGLRAGEATASLGPDGPLVFNFGLQGAGPLRELIAYERLRSAGVRPAFVFVEVLPPLFTRTDGPHQEEWWLQGERLSLAEIRRLASWHSNPSRMLREWMRSRIAPTLWHPQGFQHQLALSTRPTAELTHVGRTDEYGWYRIGDDSLSPRDMRTCTENARRQYQNTFGDFRLSEQPARALAELLACCRRDGVPAALLLMPEGSTFRNWYPPGMAAGYEAWLAEVSRREGVPLVDARDWVEDDGFWDGHHLLPGGADRFTRRWRREALEPIARPALEAASPRTASSAP